ncbi:DUF6978 family protein, partial [Lactobacillus jensenii]
EYNFICNITPIETKFSIMLVFRKINRTLIRFDFGEKLRHKNNMGTNHEKVITGSYVHIYSPNGKYDKKNVIPISKFSEFVNIKSIKECLDPFIKYTNIKW